MITRFFSGSSTPSQALEEELAALVQHGQRDVEHLLEKDLDAPRLDLVLAQQAVVDEEAVPAASRSRAAAARRPPWSRRRRRRRRSRPSHRRRARGALGDLALDEVVHGPARHESPATRVQEVGRGSACRLGVQRPRGGTGHRRHGRFTRRGRPRRGCCFEVPSTSENPSGRRVTRSPWLIQTTLTCRARRQSSGSSAMLRDRAPRGRTRAPSACLDEPAGSAARAAACRSRCRGRDAQVEDLLVDLWAPRRA